MVATLMYGGLEGMNDIEIVGGAKGLEELTTETGPDGKFAFTGLPTTATADFWISAPGRAAMSTGHARLEGTMVTMQYRAGQPGIRIVLPKEAVISGTTVDKATGHPVAGVALAAQETSSEGMPIGWTVSGADGAFEIHSLPAGKYRVVAVSGEDGVLSAIVENTEVTVRAGQKVEGVKVATSKGGIIDFVITDAATGERLGGVLVDMYGPNDEYASAYVRDDGSGANRLAPGRYRISDISKQGWQCDVTKTVDVTEGGRVKVEVTMVRLK
jgi:hypothetical protein